MDINQRFQYPAIVRSGAFNSAVIGTSTSRLLDPDHLDARFGGRFANLAMNDARAWEQYQLALLFLRATAASQDAPDRPRPSLVRTERRCRSHYDARLPRVALRRQRLERLALSSQSAHVEIRRPRGRAPVRSAGRLASRPTASRCSCRPRVPTTQSKWTSCFGKADHERLRRRSRLIRDRGGPLSWQLPGTDLARADVGHDSGGCPAPARLHARPCCKPARTRLARCCARTVCKSHLAEISRRYEAALIDFRIRSALTTNDANYWDPLHYRLPVAHSIVDAIARAVATRQDDPGGDWVMLGRRASASQ